VFRHTFLVTQVTACCASAAHISNSKQGCEETTFATQFLPGSAEGACWQPQRRCERVVCASRGNSLHDCVSLSKPDGRDSRCR
jgi:hypothetical protein